MHRLVIASQKGGSGKTTLSGHLAVEAEKAGAGPVALIDTDPQGSLSDWWNARKASTPLFVKVGSLELEDALEKLRESGVKLAVIDTPPAITGAISNVVACADLVIVPTRPSPHDLRAVGATVDIAEDRGKPVVFVINDATARARITSDTAVALSQHGTVAPVMIHNRVDFAASMVDGRTVGEVTADSKSAEEIHRLWAYVADRLNRKQHAVPANGHVSTQIVSVPIALAPMEAAPAPVASIHIAPVKATPPLPQAAPLPKPRAPEPVAAVASHAAVAPAAIARPTLPQAAPLPKPREPEPVAAVAGHAAVAPAVIARPPLPPAQAPASAYAEMYGPPRESLGAASSRQVAAPPPPSAMQSSFAAAHAMLLDELPGELRMPPPRRAVEGDEPDYMLSPGLLEEAGMPLDDVLLESLHALTGLALRSAPVMLERRAGEERREPRPASGTFGGTERRSIQHPFGRRRSDRLG
jgi:chromosome partitioning protein